MTAVSDPTRTRILKILESREICFCQVIAVVALGQSTISKHLSVLRAAGLSTDRRDRKWVHYSVDRKGASPYAARRNPEGVRLRLIPAARSRARSASLKP